MSPKYTLTRANVWPILQVFLWSSVSAIAATAIAVLAEVEVSSNLAVWIPAVNTLLYSVKEWAEDK